MPGRTPSAIIPIQVAKGLRIPIIDPIVVSVERRCQRLNPPMYKADGSWNAAKSGERSLAQMAALWNYKFFEEDRSLGVHNGVYTIQVLMDTVEALDSSFNMSARPR